MGKLIVYLGGIRSGKSALAELRFKKELKGIKARPVYLATLDSRLAKNDPGMHERIREHRRRRPDSWETIEVGKDLSAASVHRAMLLDGLGLWVALRHQDPPESVTADARAFVLAARTRLAVLVLDEAGQGGVSASASARRFADLNGRVNQLCCSAAHEVWRVDAGIATRIQ
jgi:adenosylcobinamide kinase/adenosylcobinamide-phosphate guanylyltransferase